MPSKALQRNILSTPDLEEASVRLLSSPSQRRRHVYLGESLRDCLALAVSLHPALSPVLHTLSKTRKPRNKSHAAGSASSNCSGGFTPFRPATVQSLPKANVPKSRREGNRARLRHHLPTCYSTVRSHADQSRLVLRVQKKNSKRLHLRP